MSAKRKQNNASSDATVLFESIISDADIAPALSSRTRSQVSSRAFAWPKNWMEGNLPPLQEHSAKKLEILHEYIVLYLKIILTNTQGKDSQQITIIDGFSGGGCYANSDVGSPLVILRAIRQAEYEINIGRSKPVSITPHCFFIEKEKTAFECLRYQISTSEFSGLMSNHIHLRHGSFENHVDEIISNIKKRRKNDGHRTLFFLDQCGYSEVPANVISKINIDLCGRAEFIINFSIKWMTDFLSEGSLPYFKAVLQNLALSDYVNTDELLDYRNHGIHWKHFVESKIGMAYKEATGLDHFSPFYIEPEDNHRGYWLLHLAESHRAREAMMKIHWEKSNRSHHFGPLGCEILSFKPTSDKSLHIDGMEFGENAKALCFDSTKEGLRKKISNQYKDGVKIKELRRAVCNDTIADKSMILQAVHELGSENDFMLRTANGNEKRSESIFDEDVIAPNSQRSFHFGS